MENNKKFRLEQQTKRKHLWLRFTMGCKAVTTDIRKLYALVGYVALAVILWQFRVPLFHLGSDQLFGDVKRIGFENLFRAGSVAGFVGLLMLFGMVWGAKAIHDNLQRIGFVNSAGETPLVVASYKDKDHPHVTVLEFEANGIPLTEWEHRREKIEAALDVYTVKITEGQNKRRILLHTVPAGKGLPSVLHWNDDYLITDGFAVVVGESLAGRVLVDLARVPHILLGGSTGSGKSVLLKLLLMQCVKLGAEVYIADFKGGVDFPGCWHEHCRMVIDTATLLKKLSDIVEELEHRKRHFKFAECSNLDTFNRNTGAQLPRMIFACDEVAEVLDKTGLDKQGKELVTRIEGKLSVIARQGRAFCIHLILATQRPDANILAGQIRNNIDCRACGRADNVLSQIILDSTDAADRIPKDAQGRFLMHDGTVFQAYLFDEGTAFEKGGVPYD